MQNRKINKISLWGIVALLCALCAPSFAQGMFVTPSMDGSPLVAEFAIFTNRVADSVQVIVSTQFTNSALLFAKRQNKYFAKYKITAALYDGDELVLSRESFGTIELTNYAETNSPSPRMGDDIIITAPAGKYKLFLIFTDTNAGSEFSERLTLYLPSINEIQYSTVRIFACATNDSILISKRVPLQWDSIGFACDFYVALPESARAFLKLTAPRSKTETISGRLHKGVEKSTARFIVPATTFSTGLYEAELFVEGARGKKIVSSETEFYIVHTPRSYVKYDLANLFSSLELIASPEEIAVLRAADSSSRDSLWDAFWKKRDPTPTTELNEVREEFFRRLRYCDDKFGMPTREGSATDRGKVYLEFGQPDEIENHPFESDSRPYEIWYYYTLKRTFVFVDRNGDGDYRLTESR